MRERGLGACVMEVSSHALALDRVGGVEFDVVGFTNLQRDHLDFHGDMEGYFRDKARLFVPGRARRAVICVDDEWGLRLARSIDIPVETVATRADGPGADLADWRVTDAIPGRMERVVERGPGQALCLVDYAHTPDALALALEAVRPITPGRLVIVFGSDGDRDRGKRPIMGETAARLADVLVVTDENPRSEDPADIRSAILAGVHQMRPDGRDVHEVAPRSEAVRLGVELAVEGDTVIVTGKGHEPTQEIAGVFHRYNDRDAYRTAVAERWQITERPDGVT